MDNFQRPKRVKVSSPVFKEAEGEPKRYYTEPTESIPKTTEQDIADREAMKRSYEHLSNLIPGWEKKVEQERQKVRLKEQQPPVISAPIQETPEEKEMRKENAIRLLQDTANTNIDIDELLDSGEIKEDEIEEIIQRLKQ